MVRREETASAFLATLLEYNAGFRRTFLATALAGAAPDVDESWSVRVERDSVDIVMDLDTTRVLIENKINASAKRQGQLLRYYLFAVDAVPEKRIAAVYVAPGDFGGVRAA